MSATVFPNDSVMPAGMNITGQFFWTSSYVIFFLGAYLHVQYQVDRAIVYYAISGHRVVGNVSRNTQGSRGNFVPQAED